MFANAEFNIVAQNKHTLPYMHVLAVIGVPNEGLVPDGSLSWGVALPFGVCTI